jgi:hypothetical protein
MYSRGASRLAAARSMQTDLVLDALEQVMRSRSVPKSVVHHYDRGSQYLSIRYWERLAEAGIEPAFGSVGDSYDNSLAETIIGLFKTGVIYRRGPWRHIDAVEYATLEWVDWFNHRRLLEPIGNVPRAEWDWPIIVSKMSWPLRPDSNPEVSRKVGAVQKAATICPPIYPNPLTNPGPRASACVATRYRSL